MPDDVSGAYHLPPTYYVQTGDTVLPIQHNPPLEDIASALSGRLQADGRRAWEGSQNANGHRVIGLAEGVAPTDAATVRQAVASGVPIGTMLDYAGATAPERYLMCFGQALSRALYPDLFAVIGITFGAGDGTSTFNLPDCRGRVSAGRDDMGGTAALRLTSAVSGVPGTILGGTGGAQSITLTLDQIPAHAHGASSASAGAHTHDGTTATAGTHSHAGTIAEAGSHQHSGTTSWGGDHAHWGGFTTYHYSAGGGGPGATGAITNTNTTGGHSHTFDTSSAGVHAHAVTISTDGTHAHGFTTASAGAHTHVVTIDSAGGGAAHANAQPTIIFNKIIRVQ